MRAALSRDTGPIIKSGWIWKRGEKHKAWRKRWFVLSNTGEVLYYKTQPGIGGSADAQGVFSLFGAQVDHPALQVPPGGRLPLQVHVPGRTFYLEVEGTAEHREWKQAFTKAVLRATTQSVQCRNGDGDDAAGALDSHLHDSTPSRQEAEGLSPGSVHRQTAEAPAPAATPECAPPSISRMKRTSAARLTALQETAAAMNLGRTGIAIEEPSLSASGSMRSMRSLEGQSLHGAGLGGSMRHLVLSAPHKPATLLDGSGVFGGRAVGSPGEGGEAGCGGGGGGGGGGGVPASSSEQQQQPQPPQPLSPLCSAMRCVAAWTCALLASLATVYSLITLLGPDPHDISDQRLSIELLHHGVLNQSIDSLVRCLSTAPPPLSARSTRTHARVPGPPPPPVSLASARRARSPRPTSRDEPHTCSLSLSLSLSLSHSHSHSHSLSHSLTLSLSLALPRLGRARALSWRTRAASAPRSVSALAPVRALPSALASCYTGSVSSDFVASSWFTRRMSAWTSAALCMRT